MPIIAKVGRRAFSTRLLLGAIYAILILGGASMLYPFLLMFATSTTGEPEIATYRIIPRYWFDRSALFQRFLQEKYQSLADLNPVYATAEHAGDINAWSENAIPTETAQSDAAADLWRTFCRTLPPAEFDLWFIGRRNMPGKSEMLWRDYLKARYATPADLGRAFGREISSFTEVFAPYEKTAARLWPGVQTSGVEGTEGTEWNAFKTSIAPEYRRPVDGVVLWRGYLHERFEQIADLNRIAGTAYANFNDIPLSRRLPAGPLAGAWEAWVRTRLGFRFVGLDEGNRLYAHFLSSTFGSLTGADAQLGTGYARIAPVWPPPNPTPAELDAIDNFLRNTPPISAFSVSTPDFQYVDFLASKFAGDVQAYNTATGQHVSSFLDVRPPYAQEDIAAFNATAGAWRWWALTRNYAEVVDYIAIRGRSLWNTVFLCSSLVLAAVTVNPLAAYALSRFRLSLTNQILTFLLATMAFPGEVTMIPNFLLLRHFPVWSWAAGFIVGALVCCAFVRRSESSTLRWIIAIMLGSLAGVFSALYLVPGIGHVLGIDLGPISLLNTFPALILPRLAGGFSIFLLKGFFDSLPEELFEAGRIDGAGELRMLWNLALPMSTPILAVIVLQTFTAAYGSYLWALVVCQDDSMWTLMVQIFQLQQWAPTYLTMAAAVLCSIPTLLVFVAAQNVIMRGVVVPMER